MTDETNTKQRDTAQRISAALTGAGWTAGRLVLEQADVGCFVVHDPPLRVSDTQHTLAEWAYWPDQRDSYLAARKAVGDLDLGADGLLIWPERTDYFPDDWSGPEKGEHYYGGSIELAEFERRLRPELGRPAAAGNGAVRMNGAVEIPAGGGVIVTIECRGCPDAPDDDLLYRIGQVGGGMFQRVGASWSLTIAGRTWQVSAVDAHGQPPAKRVLYDVGRNLPRCIAEHAQTTPVQPTDEPR
ncbi:MAG: hypothetical protein F4Y45_10745 [Acidobacteria bacterium]|nr:hypothetical protein [Acidobacteriota bacterium]